jgi:hypothetical protein
LKWNQLKYENLEPQHFLELKLELYTTLREPLLPVPKLRRDSNYFSSIYQDLVGNAFCPPDELELPFYSPVLETLRDSIDELQLEFSDPDLMQQFSKARWLLKTNAKLFFFRNSFASHSTGLEPERSSNIVLGLMKALKSSFKAHCKGVKAYLGTVAEPLKFLSVYNMLVRNI